MSARQHWDPKRTWVFGVGLVAYEDGAQWDEEGRKDVELLDLWVKRGVQEDKILFLKNSEGTLDAINEQLPGFLEQAEDDETLILFFAGHGGVTEKGWGVMYTYDYKEWTVPDLYYTVEKYFAGSTAMMFADCCFSGNLAADALNRAGRVRYGVLSSSSCSKASTGNWTFMNSLIDAFKGRLAVDQDGDGLLSFAELGAHCAREMAFVDGQLSTYVCTPGFNSGLILASGRKREHPRVGEFVLAKSERDGQTYKGRIAAVKKHKFLIAYDGYDEDQNEWLDEDSIGEFVPEQYELDTRVMVEFDGEEEEEGPADSTKWKVGSVRAVRHGVHLIHYDGEDPSKDEWVPIHRIKLEE
eukprot:TRINITY_DN1070_c0_g3_i1.p1 TRINITY_DN1070_c0_g3~~TRINITY_DN1070_c0_g3_i1.p1  ORF type:complete len:355 (-),score=78.45 TRINITY_DN1070_c0_g3_i1:61-1125(-)